MGFSIYSSGSYEVNTPSQVETALPFYGQDDAVSDAWLKTQKIEPLALQSISKLQMRKALTYFDILIKVEDAIAYADQETQESWLLATHFKRQDEFLNRIAKKVELSNLQLDLIFDLGATL